MHVLVLGGSGFVGSHVVEELVARGHRVRVLVRDEGRRHNLEGVLPRIDCVTGDFLDPAAVSNALRGIDVVVHLVSSTGPKKSNDDPVFDVQTNLIGSIRLFELAREHGVKKIVFLSSGGTVYGPKVACPVAETAETDPICSYGITKLAIEKYLQLFYELHGLDHVILRVANVYGERQNPFAGQGVVATFLWKLLRNEPITIWGDGSTTRDYFHAKDLARAVAQSVEQKTNHRLYNIGSGRPSSVNDILRVTTAVSGKTPVIQHAEPRGFDVPVNYLDVALARKELAWEPSISLEEGVARTWAWLQSQISFR